jgi:hypothetical protein
VQRCGGDIPEVSGVGELNCEIMRRPNEDDVFLPKQAFNIDVVIVYCQCYSIFDRIFN